MKNMRQNPNRSASPARTAVLVVLFLTAFGSLAMAQDEAPAEGEEAKDAGRFGHRPAVRQIIDLPQTFFIHGYVTGVFSDFGSDFPSEGPPPGQILVSATDNSSFQYDWALFLGSKFSDSFAALIETHFVSSPDGSFQPEIVVTEANATWMPFGPDPLRATMGLYWAPFGIIYDDWYSAANAFALVPYASQVVPLHYTERGLKLEGAFALGPKTGINYAVSVGNGVETLGVDGQHSRDFNNNKAVVARIGLFPGINGLEVGLSGMSGTLREGLDLDIPDTDPQHFAADFDAYSLDATYRSQRLKLRAYWVTSQEELIGAGTLDRDGFLVEATFTAYEGFGIIQAVEPKIRFDWTESDRFGGGPTREEQVIAVGVDIWVHAAAVLRFDYFFHEEEAERKLDNDGFAARFTVVF